MTTRTKAILGLVGVFLLGGVIGALAVGWIVRDNIREARSLREQEGFIRFFERKLHLTETQRDSLRGELATLYGRLRELRQETAREYGVVLDSFRQQVLPRLTPEQQQAYIRQEQRFRSGLPPRQGRPRVGHRGGPPPRGGLLDSHDRTSPPLLQPSPPAVQQRRDTDGVSASRPKLADTAVIDDGRPEAELTRIDRQIEKLRRKIDLRDDQVERLKQISRSAHSRIRSIADKMPRSSERRAAVRSVVADARREVIAVLTPDQRREFRKLMKQYRSRKRNARGAGE